MWWCGSVLYGMCVVVWERVIWSVCGGVGACFLQCVCCCGKRVMWNVCVVVWERVIWSVCGGMGACYMECVCGGVGACYMECVWWCGIVLNGVCVVV